MMTIDQQIAQMRADWPNWAAHRLCDQSASWQGTLKPYRTRYTVKIEQTVPMVIENPRLFAVQPIIEVLSPKLRELPGNSEGKLPHVYWRLPQTDRKGPFLCVFDTEAREWTLSDPLSRTIVPYTFNWLRSYEGWLATGKWLGFGRHYGEERTGA